MTVSNNHRVINFVICIWGCRARFTTAGTKEFFWSTCAHLRRRVRHSLAYQSESLAPCDGDLAHLAKIEHLSAFNKVLGTHNTAEAIFLRRTSELSLLLLREN